MARGRRREDEHKLRADRACTRSDRRALLESVLATTVAAVGITRWRDCSAGGLKVGQAAPPLVLHTLDGTAIATSELQGRIVIVTFWATWCEPCRTELPLLSDYYAEHADSGLSILGFALDDPEDLPKVRAIASHLQFPVGLLGSQWAGEYGRIWRLPVSFVIDRVGRLVDNGWDDPKPVWTAARLQRIVDPLLR